MSGVAIIFNVFLSFFCYNIHAETLTVSRGKSDVFSNPNLTTCERDYKYCNDRRASCFGHDCCKCQCEKEYSTFHSPGLTYRLKDGKPTYSFEGKETCVWNHYAHEGCRFIERSPSTSSRRFIPLINLDKNGTLHLKVSIDGAYGCNEYRLYTKRPKTHNWFSLERRDRLFSTVWTESTDVFLTLKWRKQGPKFGGLMLKMNFSCDLALQETREPCIILKIRGTYNTQTNISISQIPTRAPTTAPETAPTTTATEKSSTAASTFLPPSRIFFSTEATKFQPSQTKTAIKEAIVPKKESRPKKKMYPTNKTKPEFDTDKADDSPSENRGETFWILVYVFMAFAIFEVLCVALFLIYRHRRKRKQKREASPNAVPASHDNQSTPEPRVQITISPPPAYPEEAELYENESSEPRYSSIQQVQSSFKRDNSITLIENGIAQNLVSPEQRSRRNSRISQGRSIIVLPKDCVIVHTSGSKKSRQSRQSRRSTNGESSTHGDNNVLEMGIINDAGPTSDDNRSLYSWESFSSCYRTSTDEDYVSGSNRVNWEDDSLYEEPDKVIQNIKSPVKTFGLERLFALQESIINTENTNENNASVNTEYANQNANTEYANQNAKTDNNGEYAGQKVRYVNENGGYISENENDTAEIVSYTNQDVPQQNNGYIDEEHIYESAESFRRDRSLAYYENAYDLPEDALAKCLGKPNKFALKHVFYEENTGNYEDEPSLNLGLEFVNNNEAMLEGEDVKLRPTRRSTLYLHQVNDNSDNSASSC